MILLRNHVLVSAGETILEEGNTCLILLAGSGGRVLANEAYRELKEKYWD